MCEFHDCFVRHPTSQVSTKGSQAHSKHAEENWNRTLSLPCTRDHVHGNDSLTAVDNEVAKDITNDLHGYYGLYCYNYITHENRNGYLSINHTFLWLIVPQILNGLAQLLVHMTTLEFICAQAPRTIQGLLIGLWYAMFSIRYILMSSLDRAFSSWLGMLIYQATRCGLILVSLLLYLCVSRAYQYRIRDWVVNVQWMVEDVIERRMDQEERYWREQRAQQQVTIDSSSSSDNDELEHLLP